MTRKTLYINAIATVDELIATVDELIELQEAKLKGLCQHKKGLEQSMEKDNASS